MIPKNPINVKEPKVTDEAILLGQSATMGMPTNYRPAQRKQPKEQIKHKIPMK
jgi:hypothetical protein